MHKQDKYKYQIYVTTHVYNIYNFIYIFRTKITGLVLLIGSEQP